MLAPDNCVLILFEQVINISHCESGGGGGFTLILIHKVCRTALLRPKYVTKRACEALIRHYPVYVWIILDVPHPNNLSFE
jgi:hypothetical protein